ncbi:MAG: hypothetical protein NZ610_03015 [Candidatus Bipolaricaulota bacterium]|nr:hypothetical protein [Candidatus Bipolaricaulota bacterium]MCS7274362.1 hypothetical protein [Candidatus Bipolaricaulota bacterium]MDW8111573.1 hypothetical protein [Candidatus Bipolaricaulota bacterium]MDW8329881.1 hypothetical protein [Candidatus Bipolaricaulota bacterium]
MTVRLGRVVILSVLFLMLGVSGPGLAGEGARTVTLAQMVFVQEVPYAVSYQLQVEPARTSGGTQIYSFKGAAYLSGDLNRLTLLGYDLRRAAGRIVFGGLAPARLLAHLPALAIFQSPFMIEGHYDLRRFGRASAHTKLDPQSGDAHGHLYVNAVAEALNTVGDPTEGYSLAVTFAKEQIVGVFGHGALVGADVKYQQRRHDPRDWPLEGTVMVRWQLTVLSQTEWLISGEIVSTVKMDP